MARRGGPGFSHKTSDPASFFVLSSDGLPQNAAKAKAHFILDDPWIRSIQTTLTANTQLALVVLGFPDHYNGLHTRGRRRRNHISCFYIFWRNGSFKKLHNDCIEVVDPFRTRRRTRETLFGGILCAAFSTKSRKRNFRLSIKSLKRWRWLIWDLCQNMQRSSMKPSAPTANHTWSRHRPLLRIHMEAARNHAR